MLSFLSIFFNWYILALVIAVALIAAAIYFTQGPVALAKVALDARTWMALAVAVVLVTLYSSSQTIKTQQNTISTEAANNTSGGDALAVVTDSVKKKSARSQQSAKEQTVINTARTGDELDALLDEIQSEQNADSNTGAGH